MVDKLGGMATKTDRLVEQNKEFRNRPTHIWLLNFCEKSVPSMQ